MDNVVEHAPVLAEFPDAELVRLSAGGNGAAFREIMARYNGRLYRTARSILRNEAEAEDVLQEAYVRAYCALPAFRGEAALVTWLTRIVMNEALGRVRRRRPAENLDVLERGQPMASILPFPGIVVDPETASARAEVRRLLERAVDDLPAIFRVVFVLRDVEGMSIEETAAALDIRPETVKTRLHRARRQLRVALQETLSGVLSDTFPFGGARCARLTRAVLLRLGFEDMP